jgi:acetylornithine/N-succinyldiaminopimelate aminotransferase
MCEKLAELSFGEQVFLCNSGTEAIEAALKLARRHFFDAGAPRKKFVATLNGFHGRTVGALSVTGQESYRKGFEPLMQEVAFVPYNDTAKAVAAIDKDTAAFIVESIQGNGGVVLPPMGYMEAVARACRAQGALLIVDEIQTGIGRTGEWFGYQHEGITPDIICLAKALGGGLPLGAMVTTASLAAAFQPGVHGTTFGGNAVACAAGLATLHVIERDGLLANAATMGTLYRDLLRKLQKRHGEKIVDVRGRGCLIGIQTASQVRPLQAACREHGLLVTAAGANVLRFFPPLNVARDELEESIRRLDAALAA